MTEETKKEFIIGVGLCRTGTYSTKAALEQLLGGKIHHGFSFFEKSRNQKLIKFWRKVQHETATSEDWRNFFEERSYIGGIDVPISQAFEQVLKAYPEAKVVLTIRDAKPWLKSYTELMMPYHNGQYDRFPYPQLRRLFNLQDLHEVSSHFIKKKNLAGCEDSMHSAAVAGLERSEKLLRDWQDHVQKTVPKERLLVFNVKEGWEPLCKFLNRPIPDQPFPRLNDADQFKRRVMWYQIIPFSIVIGVPIILALLLNQIF